MKPRLEWCFAGLHLCIPKTTTQRLTAKLQMWTVLVVVCVSIGWLWASFIRGYAFLYRCIPTKQNKRENPTFIYVWQFKLEFGKLEVFPKYSNNNKPALKSITLVLIKYMYIHTYVSIQTITRHLLPGIQVHNQIFKFSKKKEKNKLKCHRIFEKAMQY